MISWLFLFLLFAIVIFLALNECTKELWLYSFCWRCCYCSLCLFVNVWHPVSFFKVNFIWFCFKLNSILVIDWGAKQTFDKFRAYSSPTLRIFCYCCCYFSSSSSLDFIYLREIANNTKPYRRFMFNSLYVQAMRTILFFCSIPFDRFICFTLWQQQ